jgi:NAD-dependent DNA ligase
LKPVDELRAIEGGIPLSVTPDSPTQRVGRPPAEARQSDASPRPPDLYKATSLEEIFA